MATGWMVRGSNPGGCEIFRACPDRPWGSSSLLYNGYRVFPRSKERPGRNAELSLPSSVVIMKEQSYTSTPAMGRTACREPQCLYKGAPNVFTFSGPHLIGNFFGTCVRQVALLEFAGALHFVLSQ
jgi:hypothetical protein